MIEPVPSYLRDDRSEGSASAKLGHAPASDGSEARILELDGFRAMAVLMILVHHLFYGWPLDPAAFSWMPHALVFAIGHGWLGADAWFNENGKTNRVEFTTNMPPVWNTLLTTNGNGTTLRITDTNTTSPRFYRVTVDY